MRTATKRLSLLRTVDLERELADLLVLIERDLHRAGRELDRWLEELER